MVATLARAERIGHQDAEDLFEELLLEFIEVMPSWLPATKDAVRLEPWLYGVLSTRAHKIRASRFKTGLAVLCEPASESESPGVKPEAPPALPSSGAADHLIEHLPATQRDVVKRRLRGDSYASIAAAINASVDAVRNLWRRALGRLARLGKPRSALPPACPRLPHDFVASLPPARRMVYDLYRKGLSVREIASRLHWKPHSVSNEIIELRKRARR